MTEIATKPAHERIARVLAGWAASASADGMERSAAEIVDRTWRDHRDDALAILKTLREHDEGMVRRPGDAELWTRMIMSAIDTAERSDTRGS